MKQAIRTPTRARRAVARPSEPHRVAAEAERIKRANRRRLRRMMLTSG
jgi:hypothetical protein